MALTVEATYENGVFVPIQSPGLADHGRVRLTVEPMESVSKVRLAPRNGGRIVLDPQLAKDIAGSAEFLPEES